MARPKVSNVSAQGTALCQYVSGLRPVFIHIPKKTTGTIEKRKNTLPKAERLHSERRLETLFAKGHRGGAGPVRFVWTVATEATVVMAGTPTADLATRDVDPGVTPTPPRPSTQPVEPGVSVLFSVPKKVFKRAWKRNLIKRRMRESYRTRKHDLVAAAIAAGRHIDIALICSPPGPKGSAAAGMIPDFKTVDNAIEKILAKILERR